MRLRVRFAETDQMRIAHHASYAVWLEVARVEWLRRRGLRYRDLDEQGFSLAVTGLELRYRAAARFDDLVEVDVRLVELRSRQLRFRYRLERPEDGGGRTMLAEATTTHAPTGSDGRAVRLPAPWLAALEPWLESAATG